VRSKRLYVGNLAWGVTDDELHQFFTQAGGVNQAIIILDRDTGRSRGFGFVEMVTEKGAKEAIEMLHGKILRDREIIVREAKPESEEPGGGEMEGKPKSYLQVVRDFVNKNTELGDTMKFEAEGKRFLVTREE